MKKRTLTILLCTLLATVIFVLSACDVQQSGDGTPTGTSASVEVTTTEATTEAVQSPEAPKTDPLLDLSLLPSFQNRSLEVLDLMAQASQASLDNTGHAIYWCDPENMKDGARLYGAYQGGIVWFEATMLFMIEEKVIADHSFWHTSSFVLSYYKDGEIMDLADAYERQLLTAEEIAQVWEHHVRYTFYFYTVQHPQTEKLTYLSLSPTVEHEIKQAYANVVLKQANADLDAITLRCVLSDSANGVYAMYVDCATVGHDQAVTYEAYGTKVFAYPTAQTLLIYRGGQFYSIAELNNGKIPGTSDSFTELFLDEVYTVYREFLYQ